MNPFIATVTINGLTVDYEVFFIGKKYKALLIQKYLGKYIPCQLDFWKGKEVWKSYHSLEEKVINHFGSIIENHLKEQKEGGHRNASATG